MNFSISNYKLKTFYDIELDDLKIKLKNESDHIEIFAKSADLTVNNWLIFLFIFIFFYLFNNKYFYLILYFLTFSQNKIKFYLQDVNLYIRSNQNNKFLTKKKYFIQNKLFVDLDISNLHSVFEIVFDNKTDFIGAKIGYFSLRFDCNTYQIYSRRISIRYKELFNSEIFFKQDIFDFSSLEYFKTFFFWFFYVQYSKRLLNIPGIFNLKFFAEENNYRFFIEEDEFNHEYSGIYFSTCTFLKAWINFQLIFKPSKEKLNLIQDSLIYELSFSCKKLVLENDEIGNFNLVFESIKMKYNLNFHSRFLIWIKSIDLFLPLKMKKNNHIQFFEVIIQPTLNNEITINICTMKYIFSEIFNENNYLAVLNCSNILTYIKPSYLKNKNIFTTFISNINIEESILYIKLDRSKNSLINSYKRQICEKEIELFKVITYINNRQFFNRKIDSVKKNNYLLIYSVFKYNIEINFSFGSNIKVLNDFCDVKILAKSLIIKSLFSNYGIRLNIKELYMKIKYYLCEKSYILELGFNALIQNNKMISCKNLSAQFEVAAKDFVFSIKQIINLEFDKSYLNSKKENYKINISRPSLKTADIYYNLCSFSILNINICFKFKESFKKYEILFSNISIYKVENNLNYELLNITESCIYLTKYLPSSYNMFVDIPKVKISISRDNIIFWDKLFFHKRKFHTEIFKRNINFNLKFSESQITIYLFKKNDINNFTTLLTYLEIENGYLRINEGILKVLMKEFKVFLGKLRYNLNTVLKFPFFNDIKFCKLENIDIIYYEFICNKINSDFYKINELENIIIESIYPLVFFKTNFFQSITLKFSNANITSISYIDIFSHILDNKLFLTLNSKDILILKEIISNNVSEVNFLQNVLKLRSIDFEIKLPPIVFILANFNFEDRLVLHLSNIEICKSDSITIFLKKIQIFLYNKIEDKGKSINFIFDTKFERIYLKHLECNTIFNLNILKINFTFSNRLQVKILKINSLLARRNINKLIALITEFLKPNNHLQEQQSILIYSSSEIYSINDIRECPFYYYNLRKLINEKFTVPYFYFHSYYDNAKLVHNKFEINLNYNSKYLINLNNSIFQSRINIKNLKDFNFSNYFTNYSITDYNFYLLFNGIFDKYSEYFQIETNNNLFFGIQIQLSSEISNKLNLFFASKRMSSYIINKQFFLEKNKNINFSILFLLKSPFLSINFTTENINNVIEEKNFINLSCILNLLNMSDKLFSEYQIKPGFCIGIEYFKKGRTSLLITFRNIVNIFNFSGISLDYYIGNFEVDYRFQHKFKLKRIENLEFNSIENIDNKRSLILALENSNYFNYLIFNLKDISITNTLNFELNLYKKIFNNSKSQEDDIIQLNIKIIKESYFQIIIWSPIIVENMTSKSFILQVSNFRHQIKEKSITLNRLSLSNTTLTNLCSEYDCEVLLITMDKQLCYKLRLYSENSTYSELLSIKGNTFLIQYDNFKKYSIQTHLIKIRPYWAILNYSQFCINLSINEHNLCIKPLGGYLESTSFDIKADTIKHLILYFRGFSNNYSINLENIDLFTDVINLYKNEVNRNWAIVKIFLTSNHDIYTANYNIIIERFDSNIDDTHYILENKTKLEFILSQKNNIFLSKNTFLKNSFESEIWKNTLLKKYSNKFPEQKSNYEFTNNFAKSIILPSKMNKVFYWGNDLSNSSQKFILLQYSDNYNQLINLEILSCKPITKDETKFLKFIVESSLGKLLLYHLSLTTISISRNRFYLIFHTLSVQEIQDTFIFTDLYFSFCNIGHSKTFVNNSLEHELHFAIDEVELMILEDEVLIKNVYKENFIEIFDQTKVLPFNNANFSSNTFDFSNFSSGIFLKLNKILIRAKEYKFKFDIFNVFYHIDFFSNTINLSFPNNKNRLHVSAYSTGDELLCLNFKVYSDNLKTCNIYNFITSNNYQIWDLKLNLPTLKINFEFDFYFKQLIMNLLNRSDNSQIMCNQNSKTSKLTFTIFKSNFFIKRLFLNNIDVSNYQYTIYNPMELEANSYFVISEIKKLIKYISTRAFKVLLCKNLNSIINLRS